MTMCLKCLKMLSLFHRHLDISGSIEAKKSLIALIISRLTYTVLLFYNLPTKSQIHQPSWKKSRGDPTSSFWEAIVWIINHVFIAQSMLPLIME